MARVARSISDSVDGLELLQQPDTVGDLAYVGRLQEGEPGYVTQPEGSHLQDDRGQVGAQDLRVRELRPSLEILLGVQPDTDPVRDPAAAPSALGGTGPGDRLNRQALNLGAQAVPRYSCCPGVHDIPDARHRQGGLGDVGGQDHSAARVPSEDAMLLGSGQPPIEREDLGVRHCHAGERLGGITDLTFSGEEDQYIPSGAATFGPQLLDSFTDAGDLVSVVIGRLTDERPVANLNGIRAPGHLDDGSVVEMFGESPRVNGRRGDDDLEIGTARQQLLEVSQDEVDV